MADYPDDFDSDPLGWLKNRVDQYDNQTRQAHLAQLAQMQWAAISQRAGEFTKTHRDYEARLNHVRDNEIKKLTMLGLNKAQAGAAVDQMITQQAIQMNVNGRDPVQHIYNLAEQAYGYQPGSHVDQLDGAAVDAVFDDMTRAEDSSSHFDDDLFNGPSKETVPSYNPEILESE